MLTTAQVAEMYGVSQRCAARWATRDKAPHKLGKYRGNDREKLFDQAELDEWLERNPQVLERYKSLRGSRKRKDSQ